jgi:hypothetical protein
MIVRIFVTKLALAKLPRLVTALDVRIFDSTESASSFAFIMKEVMSKKLCQGPLSPRLAQAPLVESTQIYFLDY